MKSTRLSSVSILIPALFATFSCGEDAEPHRLLVEVVDGVPHASSPAVPAWGPESRPFELVETLGADPGGEGVTFGAPMTVATGPGGNRYVLDRQEPGIFVIDPGGRLLGIIGREGEGPGEFARPADMLVRPDGTLRVLDPGSFRISRFEADGTFIDLVRTEEFLSQFEPAGGGAVFAYPRDRTPALRILPSELERDSAQVLVLDEKGALIREFAPRHRATGEMMDIEVNKLFLSTLPGDTLLLSYQSMDRVEVWSPTGRLTRVIHRPHPFELAPPQYTEQDRGPGLRPLTGSEYDILSSGLAVHPDGRFWAVLVPLGRARYRTPLFGEPEIPDRWAIELFDRDGLWLARQPLDFPATHAVLDWCSDGLYLVNRLEDAAVYRFVFHAPESDGSASGEAQ